MKALTKTTKFVFIEPKSGGAWQEIFSVPILKNSFWRHCVAIRIRRKRRWEWFCQQSAVN